MQQTVPASAVDAAAKSTLTSLGDLIASAKAVGEQSEDSIVLDGARSLSEAIQNMLEVRSLWLIQGYLFLFWLSRRHMCFFKQAAAACQQAPNDTSAVEAFRESQLGVQKAATYVQAATTNTLADQVNLEWRRQCDGLG